MAYPTKSNFTFDWTAQGTYPSWDAEQAKINFGAQSEELKTALNAVVAILNAVTDGASGADNLGMTAITALGAGATVQSIVEALVTKIQSTTAGNSGAKFTGVETIAGLTGNDVQTLLAALKTLISSLQADIVTVPDAGKILRLDAQAKLPTSITGDSETVGGKTVAELTDNKWEFISSILVDAPVAFVEFNNLNGYKDLLLRFEGVSSYEGSANLNLTCNDDLGVNYHSQQTRLLNSSTQNSVVSAAYFPIGGGLAAASRHASIGKLEISNFSALTFKRILGDWYAADGVGTDQLLYSSGGVWKNNLVSIGKITLTASGGNIGTGSRFRLWGMK